MVVGARRTIGAVVPQFVHSVLGRDIRPHPGRQLDPELTSVFESFGVILFTTIRHPRR